MMKQFKLSSISELVKFTALASLLAIFADAAIAHSILWGNDPYWSYWITDTLLMATVYGLGTAWLGIGLRQGAIITAIHITILTTYYWILSPIGLPSSPEWLDFERTWLTGLPVHFGVYFLGYCVALWLWNQRFIVKATRSDEPDFLLHTAGYALATSAGVVIVAGLVQALLIHEFPGVTWFIVRIAVAFPFTLAWWKMAGRGRNSSVWGGITLGFLLMTYSHFLGSIGLPNESLRLFEGNPPSADVHWLSYRQEYFILLPITQIVAIIGFLISSAWTANEVLVKTRWNRSKVLAVIASLVVLIIVGAVTYPYTGREADIATVNSAGQAKLEQGAAFNGKMIGANATLSMNVENRNTHRTPLKPHDVVNIKASISGANPGSPVYVIDASHPMVSDPMGRYTTFSGVGYNVWHHGRSGIGTKELPATKSDIAVYALGNISFNGQPIAAGVPVHVMNSTHEGARLELHVGDPEFPLPGIENGHLRVVWSDYTGGHGRTRDYARYGWGGTILIILIGFAVVAVRRHETFQS